MLRIATFMTGDDYSLLKSDTPASRRKVIGLAIAMTVPVIVWLISGYLLASRVLGHGILSSIITGIICSIIIFLLEKMIIMSKGGGILSFFRILIGLILAMLGSLSLDEVVFHDDISRSVSKLKVLHGISAADSARIEFERMNGFQDLRTKIQDAKEKYETAEADVINEANGTYGTGKIGVGRITALKERKASDRRIYLESNYRDLARLDSAKAIYIENARQHALNTFSENGLLTRIKALADLVKSDSWMLFTYTLFTLLMLLIEFLVVIFKSSWGQTNYERRLEMIEKIGAKRMALLMKDESPVYDPNYSDKVLQSAKQFIHKTISFT
jgi:ABC-type multidrug transport system fused ATPase/permease subunit